GLTAAFSNNEQYSDIVIKFGEHQIRAHKVVLAQQSGYFATAFFSHFQVASNPVIDLGDEDDPELLTSVIRYLYCCGPIHDNVPNFSLDRLSEFYLIADKYDISKLRCEVAEFFHMEAITGVEAYQGTDFMKTFVGCVVKFCGSFSFQLADTTLQHVIIDVCMQQYMEVFRDKVFLKLYKNGELFDLKNAAAFGLFLGKRLLNIQEMAREGVNDMPESDDGLVDHGPLKRIMNNFFNERMSDITLIWGDGQKIFAHKVVLAAHSSYLQNMLKASPTIDLGDKYDSAATAAFIEDMYTCHNTACLDLSSKRSISSLADMYLLAKKLRRDDAAEEYKGQCADVLSKQKFSDELLSQVATLCGPDSKSADTSFAEMVFANILYRVRGGKVPETFAEKLADGSLFNATFTRRFANEILGSFLGPKQPRAW
ncbi:unnamed protein product, partial [Aureobasidium vineae]